MRAACPHTHTHSLPPPPTHSPTDPLNSISNHGQSFFASPCPGRGTCATRSRGQRGRGAARGSQHTCGRARGRSCGCTACTRAASRLPRRACAAGRPRHCAWTIENTLPVLCSGAGMRGRLGGAAFLGRPGAKGPGRANSVDAHAVRARHHPQPSAAAMKPKPTPTRAHAHPH